MTGEIAPTALEVSRETLEQARLVGDKQLELEMLACIAIESAKNDQE